ncbi:hypothetical protein [Deinococcus sp. Marseille-Q6407]|uniref:hypothetical protein n=1 Tax=Deinococcus sp. Marseille-Q6407 TaxID=2969223 RepID=UPI0021BE0129|nr:hypothetical protein [Deinococcus sp. Marseille-Q6407]
MLRLAFWLTALLLLPLGLGLYWLPQPTASLIGASPLWLVRGTGALLTAWGLGLLYGGYRADPTGRVNLVAGNLLLAATLGAAALRLDLAPFGHNLLLGGAALLLVLGLIGLLAGSGQASPRPPAGPVAPGRPDPESREPDTVVRHD